MFDHEAVHVDDPERAVGTGAHLDRTEPVVGAGEEVGTGFVGGTVGGESEAVRREGGAADQVVDGFADEGVALVLRPEVGVPVDLGRAGAGEVVGGVGIVEAFQRDAGGKDAVVVAVGWDPGLRRFDAAGGGIGREGVAPEKAAVVVPKPIPEVVAHPSLLADAGEGFEFPAGQTEPEVASRGRNLPPGGRVPDASAEESAGTVDPVVESPAESVDAGLEVVGGEAGEEDFTAGTIRRNEQDVRCGADEDLIAPDHQSGGERESGSHHGGLVESSVAIGVREDLEPSAGFESAVEAGGVIGHLADPETAVVAEIDRDGRLDEVVAGDEVDGEIRREREGFEGASGFLRRRHFSRLRRGQERGAEKGTDGADDLVLDGRIELLRAVVVPEGGFGLIAALAEDAAGRNVAGDVVGVAVDPESGGVEFGLEAEGVVDDDLAAEEDHGEVGAEGEGLDRVRQRGRGRFVAVESRDPAPGVVADDSRGLRAFLPLVAGEVGLEGKGDDLLRGAGRFIEGREGKFQQSAGFGGEASAVLLDEFDRSARVGVGIGAASDGNQCGGSGQA